MQMKISEILQKTDDETLLFIYDYCKSSYFNTYERGKDLGTKGTRIISLIAIFSLIYAIIEPEFTKLAFTIKIILFIGNADSYQRLHLGYDRCNC